MKKAVMISAMAAGLALLCLAVSPATSASGSAKKEVTFNKDVASILFNNCAECHRPNDIAPMSLLSYKEARPWARSIKEKVANREMPPWSPDPAYGEFTNDHRLAQKDIDTIVAWVDQGAKEGNPKDLPKMPEFVSGGWAIGKPDVVLQMAEEHTVKPNDPDQYINFFIPTNFKEDMWVQAAEIHPGNRRVVHHVIAFIQTPQTMAKRAEEAKAKGEKIGKRAAGGSGLFYLDGNLRRVKMDAPVVDNACEQRAPGGRQPGGGGDGENEGMLLAGFAPGTGNTVYPPGTAKKLPAGSTLMFQMHYSAFRGSLTGPITDRTSIGLIFAKNPPEKMVITSAAANLLFKIPAGADNHEVLACQTIPRDIQVINYMPHMHLRGKDMKYELVYPDG
ncbi:MAG TPA: hypothetical protein VLE20_01105, partial [Blastocatellia bacterium]|nr:hypothetical protein [Blastocatellia bacterium]